MSDARADDGQRSVYLDNQSTTRVDPRVVDAMLPFWTEQYGNAGSTSHAFGAAAKEAVEAARRSIAHAINAQPNEILFTSGATESNNLAIRGAVMRRRAPGKHVVSVETEHRAVLDPLQRLRREGYQVAYLPALRHPDGREPVGQLPTAGKASAAIGTIDLDQLRQALRPDTALVSVMLANNETGVIQPLAQIAAICRESGALLHCDATQAVGKLAVDVVQLGADLVSFSAHKLHGPKGIGALFVAGRSPQIRLVPLVDGGGQERGMRSGTLPVPLIVGFAKAIELCLAGENGLNNETQRLHRLRQQLHDGLTSAIPGCHLNGPAWSADPVASAQAIRLPHNLNMRFDGVEGESIMLSAPSVAISSGSACTSASPQPSHVLQAIGLTDDQVRSSLRFGLGRFNTTDDVVLAVEQLSRAVQRLRQMG